MSKCISEGVGENKSNKKYWREETKRYIQVIMSASALLAGVAVGGVRYGYIKFQLHERENVVQYSVDAVKQAFHGEPKVSRLLIAMVDGERAIRNESHSLMHVYVICTAIGSCGRTIRVAPDPRARILHVHP